MSRSWYPFYPGDYLRDTRHLTLEQDGAYRRLIDHYFMTQTPIEATPKALGLAIGISTHKAKALFPTIVRLFQVKDGRLYHNRIEKELKKGAELSNKLSKAAQKRWHAQADAQADAQAYASPQPQDIYIPVESKSGTERPHPIPDDFTPSLDTIDYCKKHRLPVISNDIVQRFINVHRAKGQLVMDEQGAFRAWMINEKTLRKRLGRSHEDTTQDTGVPRQRQADKTCQCGQGERHDGTHEYGGRWWCESAWKRIEQKLYEEHMRRIASQNQAK